MGLGPSLSIRQIAVAGADAPADTRRSSCCSFSNLELEAFIAEELSKNPLLEARPATSDDEQPAARFRERRGRQATKRRTIPGADDLIRGQADDDRPLDIDWTAEALETDSFADVVTSGGGEEAFDFDRLRIFGGVARRASASTSSTAHPGDVGDLARIIAETLDETGYLTVPLDQIAELTGAPLAAGRAGAGARPGPRPAGRRRALARRMPRAAGQGRRPLRPGDGAADRQSRPAVEGPDRRTSSASAGSTTRISPT